MKCSMRLFTALDLPPDILGNLEALLDRLRPTAHIRWSPPANLHITTKFIGEWPEDRFSELTAALAALPVRDPVFIRVGPLGFFPTPRSPRSFHVAIQSPTLADLAAATELAAASLGIEAEKRPYKPHLTLARIKEPGGLARLHEAIARLDSQDFGAFEACSFFLYRSQMRSGGSVYTKLAEFPLSRS